VCEGKGHIISGARRWKRKYQPNEKADNGSALDGGGERTCPGLIDRDPCRQPDKKSAWTASANSAQQKTPSATMLRRMPMMIMVVGPATGYRGRAFHHHHRGAIATVNRSRARLESPAVMMM
jgi:hypothetical protein